MNAEPDYVNEPLEAVRYGDIPDKWRCQYRFRHSHEYNGRDVKGRPCGLLSIEAFEEVIGAPRCYFHLEGSRADDEDLKERLERTASPDVYLGEATLLNAHLQRAVLVRPHLESARFEGAHLRGADLRHAHLERADLTHADLQRADLREAHLQNADLRFAHLQHANLSGASLHGTLLKQAHLERAKLSGADLATADLAYAHLDGARLWGARLQGANLWEAQLAKADLLGARLEGALLLRANLRGANLQHAELGILQEADPVANLSTSTPADLRGANLRGARLADVSIAPEADLSQTQIDPRIRDEREARTSRDYAHCQAVYRQLKLNFQESGDYLEAGKFFIREMECKRARMLRDPETQPAFWGRAGALLLLMPFAVALLFRALTGKPPDHRVWLPWGGCGLLCFALWAWPARHRAPAVGLTLWYWLCGYGEQLWRIAVWIALVIVVSALLHGAAGVADLSTGRPVVILADAWPWGPDLNAWATCLYFSVITFTSLGYADLAPSPGWGRFLAGAEAGIGFVLMSLLLVCIVRKFTR